MQEGSGGLGQGGTPFKPQVLVRFGADPIQFTYKPLKASADALVIDPVKGSAGLGKTAFSAALDVPADAGSVYVMIVSTGQLDGAYTALSLTTEQSTEMGTGGAGGSTSTTGGTTTTTGAGGSGGEGSQEIGGCGCALPASGGDTRPALAALAALGLAAARRRRRSA